MPEQTFNLDNEPVLDAADLSDGEVSAGELAKYEEEKVPTCIRCGQAKVHRPYWRCPVCNPPSPLGQQNANCEAKAWE